MAAAEGAFVLYGACDAVVQAPYGPFVEALDRLARVTDPAELRSAIGPGGGELGRLLPDLPARVGDLPAPVNADPDTERHRLHTAVTDLLAGVSRERPVLLVIEDGHWADAPTLLLLRHLARSRRGRPPAGVGDLPRYRGRRTARRCRRRSPTCAGRTTSCGCGSTGLTAEEVAEFVHRAAGADPGAGPAELAARRSATSRRGTPFLVCELWRALVETRGVEVVDGAIHLTRPLTELGSPGERSRGGQRAPLAAGAGDNRPARAGCRPPGPEFELEILRRAAGLEETELMPRWTRRSAAT